MKPLSGKRILLFVGDDYEDLELWYPLLRLREAGATTTVAGLQDSTLYHGKHGYPCTSDASLAEVRSADFDALVIPGGWMPDKLRRDEKVLALVREFHRDRKPIGVICHGPWIMISAGVCRGLTMTSTPGIKDDVINAGANWLDRPVVVDGHVVSSRRPDDLPEFCAELLALIETGPRKRG